MWLISWNLRIMKKLILIINVQSYLRFCFCSAWKSSWEKISHFLVSRQYLIWINFPFTNCELLFIWKFVHYLPFNTLACAGEAVGSCILSNAMPSNLCHNFFYYCFGGSFSCFVLSVATNWLVPGDWASVQRLFFLITNIIFVSLFNLSIRLRHSYSLRMKIRMN